MLFFVFLGCAQYIEWNPLKATPISLPSNAYFVIANSLTRANKAATSDFNQRVVECRLACRIMAKKLNFDWRHLERFALLQKELNCNLHQFEEFADRILSKDIYTLADITNALEITDEELENDFLTSNTRHLEKLKLRQRALHVIQGNLFVHNNISRPRYKFSYLIYCRIYSRCEIP